jgi:hypothetical protein
MSTMPMSRGGFGQPVNEQGILMQDISQQRKLAEQLRKQGADEIQGQMVSGHYVAPSWTQQLARVLNTYAGTEIEGQADKKEQDYNAQKSKKFADILAGNKPQQIEGQPQISSTMPAYTPEQQDQFGSPLPNVQREPVVTSTPTMTQESPEAMQARQQQAILQYMQQYGNTPEAQYMLAQIGKQDDRAYAKGEKLEDRAYTDTREEKLYNRGRTDKLSDIDAERKYQDIVRADTQGFQVSQQDRQFAQQYKLQAQSQGFQANMQDRQFAHSDAQNALTREQQLTLAGMKAGGVNSPQQKLTDAKDVLSILNQAAPLVNKSTNSGIGNLYDQSAAFFGNSTEGAQASAQLKALEGTLVSKMPKMSGPQSDKDVLLYKQMAGQIGDPTIPAAQKQAAMNTINELNSRYAGVPLTQLPYGNKTNETTVQQLGGLPPNGGIRTVDW